MMIEAKSAPSRLPMNGFAGPFETSAQCELLQTCVIGQEIGLQLHSIAQAVYWVNVEVELHRRHYPALLAPLAR